MKLNFKLIFAFFAVFLLFILCSSNAQAAVHSTDDFSIDIPSTFKVNKNINYLEAESYDGQNMIMVQSADRDTQYIVSQNYIDAVVQSFKDTLGGDFTLIDSKLIEQNGCKGMDLKYRQIESGLYVYVNLFYFISDNNTYMCMVMSLNQSYLTSKEKNDIISSFKIKDTVSSSNGIPFTDVPSNSWYYNAVKYTYEKNMIKGNNDYTFAPNENLTRAMLVTILHRMEGAPYVSGTSKFKDVQNTKEYYYVAVKWATKNNIVSGYENGNFGPNDPITREQLAVILNKYCRYKGKYNSKIADITKFKDSKNVSNFAIWEMRWAVANGVITGTNENTLNPKGKATRAEVAAMLHKYCINIK